MSYLCSDHDVPIGLITAAISGAWLKQWLKSANNHYAGMISTVSAATRGTMKVRALLWFQGEADCNPSAQYAGLSFDGDHDLYLASLNAFVADVHRDMSLDTVYVGSIGNVPHFISGQELSNRENIYGIRRALQSSWSNPRVSPGPVTYDIALDTDSIHIHFNSPEEMIPFSKWWAAAISEFTYGVGAGRGPILQGAQLAADDRTVTLTFDQDLAVSDFKDIPGTTVEGWSFEIDGTLLTAADIISATAAQNAVTVFLRAPVAGNLTVSYGIDDDGAGRKIIRGLTGLPAEPIYRVPVNPGG